MIVSIVDDDKAVRDALGLLLEANQFAVERFDCAAKFLQSPPTNGCIIADVRMPRMSGLELLQTLKETGDTRPVIILTGHGDVEMAMKAVKLGAIDFIEKPFNSSRLLGAISDALERSRASAAERAELVDLRERYSSLTERQRQTMELLIEGHSNKDIGSELGISPRTVEVYRAWVLNKMGARTLAQLVRIGLRLKG